MSATVDAHGSRDSRRTPIMDRLAGATHSLLRVVADGYQVSHSINCVPGSPRELPIGTT